MIDALRRLLARVTSDISQQCTLLNLFARSQILMRASLDFSLAKRGLQARLSELVLSRAHVELEN